ncbi:hypothetical protein [Paenibacillus pini]|nr:hypothetical protein [Paenibacillus pini]
MALSPENITKLQQVRDELTTEPDPEESDAEVEPFLKKHEKIC